MDQKKLIKTKRVVYEKSAWIYIRNRRILVVRSEGCRVFFLPGGGKEKEETLKNALIREIKEELSVNLIPKIIKYITSFKSPTHEDPERSDVIMHCFKAKFTGSLKISNEIKEMGWFTYRDINRVSQADQYVLDYLKLKGIID